MSCDIPYLEQELDGAQARYWAELQDRKSAEARAKCYSDRMATIHAIAERALDGRLWKSSNLADGIVEAQMALAQILDIAGFKVPA